MKNRKASVLGTVAALVATAIIGAAPASAAVTPLPEGANGVDNSRINYLACEDRLIVSVPLNVDFEGSLPFEGAYFHYITTLTLDGENTQFDSALGRNKRVQTLIRYEPKNPGETIDIEFSSFTLGMGETSNSFDMEVTVVDSDRFAGGDGTAANPYLVSNVKQLNLVRCHDNAYFKLTKNLDMKDRTWMPIGQSHPSNEIASWRGYFDGGGHTIRNLEIENNYSTDVGLFGTVDYSSFSNLTLKNFEVGGEISVGTLVGRSKYSSYSNISIKSSKVKGRVYLGLLAGKSDLRSGFSGISVKGKVVAAPYLSERHEQSENCEGIGGVVGYEDAGGSMWENIKSNVKISLQATPEVAGWFYAQQENERLRFENIGGVVGESGEGAAYNNIRNKVEVKMNTGAAPVLNRFGGAFGFSQESFATNVVSNAQLVTVGENLLTQVGGFIGFANGTVTSHINSTFKLKAELGSERSGYVECIGGFAGRTEHAGSHDIKSKASMKLVVVKDLDEDAYGYIGKIGGFVGDDAEAIFNRIQTDASVTLVAGNGDNNSLNSNIESNDLTVRYIGGFAGNRQDNSNYTRIKTNADIAVSSLSATQVGGFVGANTDSHAIVLRNVIASGSVTLDENVSQSGAFFGETGPFQLMNVISSIALNPNGATDRIGYVFGAPFLNSPSSDEPIVHVLRHSYYKNAFFNNKLPGASNQAGTALSGRKGKALKSAKFLQANGFGLPNVYSHIEGRLPVVKIKVPFAKGAIADQNK
jgi:hypothetical protein